MRCLAVLFTVAPAAALLPLAKSGVNALSRRAAVEAGILAVLLPQASHAEFGDGCVECQQNRELTAEESPLIQKLKKQTEDNKAKNAAAVKENIAYTNTIGLQDDRVKLVRYASADDALGIPVTRMLEKEQVKELEKAGFELDCPSWGGACSLKEKRGKKPGPPPAPAALAE